MANYSDLIQTINDSIKANGNQEITGPVLNGVLKDIANALIYNIRQDVFINNIPVEIDSINRTIKVPAQTITIGDFNYMLAEDVIITTDTDVSWRLYYIIFDNTTKSFEAIPTNSSRVILDENTYYFATVRFSVLNSKDYDGYVFNINSPTYILDGVLCTSQNAKNNSLYYKLSPSKIYTGSFLDGAENGSIKTTITNGATVNEYIYNGELELYASGYTPSSTYNLCAVAYYDADMTFISSQGWIASRAFYMERLTVPQNAKYIRIMGNNNTTSVVTTAQPKLYSKTDEIKKETKKILVIGNSYSLDSFMYFPFILRNYGIPIRLGIYYRSGGSLQNQVEEWDSAHNPFYYIDSDVDKSWTTVSESYNPKLCCQYLDWDMVIIQQSSIDSVDIANYRPYTRELIRLIKDVMGKPIMIGWNININRASSGADYTSIANSILNNIKEICGSEAINYVFPYGTAIFNARTNDTLKDIGDGGNLWSSDKTHLQEGLPCYLAAITNVQAFFNLFYPELSIVGDDTRATQTNISNWNVKGQHGQSVGVTSDNMYIAQICAIAAVNSKFVITTIP